MATVSKIPVFKWRDGDVVTFLEYYKHLECLWNNRISDYRDKEKRARAYEILRRSMRIPNLTVKDVKNKIKGLRTTYSDELNKILETSGPECEKAYVPSVFWFNLADSFLRGVTKGRKNTSYVSESFVSERDLLDNALESNEFCIEYEQEVEVESEEGQLVYDTPSTSPASAGHCVYTIQNHQTDVKPPVYNQKETDEFDLFGRSLAIQLRKLQELDALDLMQKIQMMIFQKNQQLKQEDCETTQNIFNMPTRSQNTQEGRFQMRF